MGELKRYTSNPSAGRKNNYLLCYRLNCSHLMKSITDVVRNSAFLFMPVILPFYEFLSIVSKNSIKFYYTVLFFRAYQFHAACVQLIVNSCT